MNRFLMLTVLSACARSSAPVQAPPATPPRVANVQDLAPILEPIRSRHQLPALAGAIVDGQGLRALGATGVRAVGSSDSVLPEDAWHLGSDTKAMTSTLAALLVQDGVISWDTRVETVWPDAHADWHGATLQQLLQHRAGASSSLALQHLGLWTELVARRDEPDGYAARTAFAASLLAQPPDHARGTYHYSNAGYILAGAMLEARTGETWQTLMRTRLFEPLGMNGCGFGAPPDPAPHGHAAGLLDIAPVAPGPAGDNPPALGPAGTVYCPLPAWGAFVSAHLRAGRGDDPLLPAEAWKALHTPDGEYALGWIVTERKWAGGTALTHAGSNTMWYANVWMAPGRDRAFLVATNSGARSAAKATDVAVGALLEVDEAGAP